jgi:hypothetical protein
VKVVRKRLELIKHLLGWLGGGVGYVHEEDFYLFKIGTSEASIFTSAMLINLSATPY